MVPKWCQKCGRVQAVLGSPSASVGPPNYPSAGPQHPVPNVGWRGTAAPSTRWQEQGESGQCVVECIILAQPERIAATPASDNLFQTGQDLVGNHGIGAEGTLCPKPPGPFSSLAKDIST